MGIQDILDVPIELTFIALGALAVIDFFRHRDQIRRDVALLFGTLAVPSLVQVIARIYGVEISDGNSLAIIALILEPYLLLRLVRYLRAVPPYMMRLTIGWMIATVIAGIFLEPRIPWISMLVGQSYLIGLNLYAMAGFVRGALTATDVTRQRLRFAAVGSGLLATLGEGNCD
jgi:hypothetical protein